MLLLPAARDEPGEPRCYLINVGLINHPPECAARSRRVFARNAAHKSHLGNAILDGRGQIRSRIERQRFGPVVVLQTKNSTEQAHHSTTAFGGIDAGNMKQGS